MQKNGRWLKPAAFILLIAAVYLLDRRFHWSAYLKNTDAFLQLRHTVDENLPQALLIYIAATVVGCAALALPGMTFALAAGMLFGPVWGSLACLVGTTLGAMLAFLVGRFFLKDAVKPMLEKSRLLKSILFSTSPKSGIILLMITRLVPLFPYNLQNFAYGVTDIGFIRYSALTFVFMLPGVLFFTLGGAGIAEQSNRGVYFAVAAALAVILAVAALVIKKKYLPDAAPIQEGVQDEDTI
ncbi:MAG: TVP38/TMEM64 family protein [Christensenellaceae bacterium]|jgi:uncharacterized membrane protein YdjX (TVP38/TMEM64 family)|nr:TVP38/TMEM64 family protein [Christensenellaceae bacterium]